MARARRSGRARRLVGGLLLAGPLALGAHVSTAASLSLPLEAPSVSVKTPAVKVTTPPVTVTVPPVTVRTPSPPAKAPTVTVKPPTVTVKAPTAPAPPPVPVKAPSVSVKAPAPAAPPAKAPAPSKAPAVAVKAPAVKSPSVKAPTVPASVPTLHANAPSAGGGSTSPTHASGAGASGAGAASSGAVASTARGVAAGSGVGDAGTSAPSSGGSAGGLGGYTGGLGGYGPMPKLEAPAGSRARARIAARERILKATVARLSGCLVDLPNGQRELLELRTGAGGQSALSPRAAAAQLHVAPARFAALEKQAVEELGAAARTVGCARASEAIAAVAAYLGASFGEPHGAAPTGGVEAVRYEAHPGSASSHGPTLTPRGHGFLGTDVSPVAGGLLLLLILLLVAGVTLSAVLADAAGQGPRHEVWRQRLINRFRALR